jgi:hypothetical protein
MRSIKNRITASLLAITALTTMSNLVPASAQSPAIEPAAVEMLKSMTDHISGLKQFSVDTQNTLEHVLDSGQRIDEDISVSVIISRPDKLRSSRLGGLIDQVFYYDGKNLTLNNKNANVYATEKAPATVEQMLDFARESLGLILPASDLVYRNVNALMMQDVTSATVVGKAVINGKTCNHLAFRRPDVDFQVWIADAGEPLPCKYVVTDTSSPELVSTISVMSNWNVKPTVTDNTFSYKPGKGTTQVEFMPLESGASK